MVIVRDAMKVPDLLYVCFDEQGELFSQAESLEELVLRVGDNPLKYYVYKLKDSKIAHVSIVSK